MRMSLQGAPYHYRSILIRAKPGRKEDLGKSLESSRCQPV